jgi:hypothetical protein
VLRYLDERGPWTDLRIIGRHLTTRPAPAASPSGTTVILTGEHPEPRRMTSADH